MVVNSLIVMDPFERQVRFQHCGAVLAWEHGGPVSVKRGFGEKGEARREK
jgi:hypothetical protein